MNNYDVTSQCTQELPGLSAPSLRQSLEYQLQKSQEETKRLQELLSLMDKNPETQRILELLGRKY